MEKCGIALPIAQNATAKTDNRHLHTGRAEGVVERTGELAWLWPLVFPLAVQLGNKGLFNDAEGREVEVHAAVGGFGEGHYPLTFAIACSSAGNTC